MADGADYGTSRPPVASRGYSRGCAGREGDRGSRHEARSRTCFPCGRGRNRGLPLLSSWLSLLSSVIFDLRYALRFGGLIVSAVTPVALLFSLSRVAWIWSKTLLRPPMI